MNNEDRYYEPEDDTDGEEIQERIDYELKHNNYPYAEANIYEALADEALVPHLATIASFLQEGKTDQAGLMLSSALYTYWEDRTEREVLENL